MNLHDVITNHPVFATIASHHQQRIADSASQEEHSAGSYLFHERQPATSCYIILRGTVALSTYAPNRGAVTIQTLHDDDVLGWSWLYPPYEWHFDARALADTSVILLDGVAIREQCAGDHELGYQLFRTFGNIMLDRLQASRKQLLDVYGTSRPTT